MQFLIRILAIIIIAFIIFCFVIGFTNEPQNGFTHTVVINSPGTVVWHAVTSPDHMVQWMQEVEAVHGPPEPQKNSVYRFYLRGYETDAFHEEKIDILNPESRISFLRVEAKSRPLLRDFLQLYEFKSLRDGTTEITYRLSYRCDSFLTIVYDRLHLAQQMQKTAIKSLNSLKKNLEKV